MSSKSLFAKQIEVHAQSLSELLGCPGGDLAPADVAGRVLVGTRMLAGTSSLMGLEGWAGVCNAYRELLQRYVDRRLPWDERIAGVTSELIEREEAVASAILGDPTAELVALVETEEVPAMVLELNALVGESESLSSVPESSTATRPVPQPAAPQSPPATDRTPAASRESAHEETAPAATVPQADATPATPEPAPRAAQPAEAGPTVPMAGVIAELRSSFDRLQELFVGRAWATRTWGSEDIREIRRELGTLAFFTGSLESAIRANANGAPAASDLLPIRTALADFAGELSRGGGRRISVTLSGEDYRVDPAMLPVAHGILQSMVRDIHSCARSNNVTVRVEVEERDGAMRWRVSDDGENFVSDSAVDSEDQLAFYRNLRRAMQALERVHGVLSVEPEGAGMARFEFTTPVAESPASVASWGEGGHAFAVRSSQLCALLPGDAASRDTFGECIHAEGRRIPLVRLDALYSEASAARDAIAILGSVEKRIALYVPGQCTRTDSTVFSHSIPVWRGAPQQVAEFGDRRVPLFDAAGLLEAYLAVTGALQTEPVSGGVTDEHSESVRSQASSRADETAPPENSAEMNGEREVVLVVEQSESMRDELADILTRSDIDCECVPDVDAAFDALKRRRPGVIVSEFRMPTMAARRIVESLSRDNVDVPVIVTTSQTGQNAELLARKLGASGYLSKPLDAAAVASRIGEALSARVDS